MASIAQSIIPITDPHRRFLGHTGSISAVARFPDGRRIVTGSHDKSLRLWDLEGSRVLKTMNVHRDKVKAVAVSRDGKFIASVDHRELIAWDGDSGEHLKGPFETHSNRITSLDFSPDSAELATLSRDKGVTLWRTDTWEPREITGNSIDVGETMYCVRYSPSGELLATAARTSIQIWNRSALEPIAQLRALDLVTSWNISLAWAPDDTRIFSGRTDSDPTILEWDVSTWRRVGDPWSGHTHPIYGIAVNSSGTLVASASDDKHVRLWRLSDRRTISIFEHSRPVTSVTFSADDKYILSGGQDAILSQWEVPTDALLEGVPEEQVSDVETFPIIALEEQGTNNAHDPEMQVSDADGAIRKVIDTLMENTPPRLFDTFTGRLCDRDAVINSFKMSEDYTELLSSTMACSDLRSERVQNVVSKFFRYVMLSHRWEGKEPLLQIILGKNVYELNPVGGIAKLQSFCEVAPRDRGYRWAWSDTCCIDKNNNIDLQESVNSMFIWYHHSALTIVYLSDVPPSSKSGALARSVWNSRGWTVQEFLAPKVVLFYQKDWTLYLDDQSPNHKESASIIQELADATGISSQALVSFRPEMRDAREKLQWSSKRVTKLQEDIAYSLFGTFGVHLSPIYGEKKQNALGRLLQEIVAQSGDISCLDWVGKSSEFNSCLPASITVYADPPFMLPSLSEDEMQASVSSLRDAGESASRLHDRLDQLTAPRFAHHRLHLPCIVFTVSQFAPRLSHEDGTKVTYAVEANDLHDLLITTEDTRMRTMPRRQKLLVIRPWDRNLLELPDFAEPSDVADDVQSNETEDFRMPPSSPPPFCESRDAGPGENMLVDSESDLRALRLLVRLGRPFRAFLLAQQRGGEYKRIAADYDIIAQVKDVRDMMDIRTLEIL